MAESNIEDQAKNGPWNGPCSWFTYKYNGGVSAVYKKYCPLLIPSFSSLDDTPIKFVISELVSMYLCTLSIRPQDQVDSFIFSWYVSLYPEWLCQEEAHNQMVLMCSCTLHKNLIIPVTIPAYTIRRWFVMQFLLSNPFLLRHHYINSRTFFLFSIILISNWLFLLFFIVTALIHLGVLF